MKVRFGRISLPQISKKKKFKSRGKNAKLRLKICNLNILNNLGHFELFKQLKQHAANVFHIYSSTIKLEREANMLQKWAKELKGPQLEISLGRRQRKLKFNTS